MKKMKFGEESAFSRLVNGRGFYVVLALCVVILGAVGVALSMPELTSQRKEGVEPSVSEVRPVEQTVTGQPDVRTTTTTTSSTVVTTTTTAKPGADLFVLPFGNLVQKAFSDGKPVYSETMGDWRVHIGADFAGESGGTIKAIADGEVIRIEEDPLWGQVLVIDHGLQVVSRYCGVKTTLQVNDKVEVGQPVGTLDGIPCESNEEPHLHLEMTVEGQLVDPVMALGRDVRYAENVEE